MTRRAQSPARKPGISRTGRPSPGGTPRPRNTGSRSSEENSRSASGSHNLTAWDGRSSAAWPTRPFTATFPTPRAEEARRTVLWPNPWPPPTPFVRGARSRRPETSSERSRRSPSSTGCTKTVAAQGSPWPRSSPAWPQESWRTIHDALRHKVADVNGPVHYIDFGGSGPTLLMVHGLAGSALNWMAVAPQIARTHHALAIDLAGFGQTPLFGRTATVGVNAALVHDFIEMVAARPVSLMGNSMGGHIAILEASAHPDWVNSLVLVDPAIPGVHVRRPEPMMLGP